MGKYSKIAHYQDFTELEKIISLSNNVYDMEKIRKAYKMAEDSHGDQRRVSGIPYILHPTSVACIVAELGMDTDSICSALLHDVVEDTDVSLEQITKLFGSDVAKLIDGLTKISKIQFSSREQQQAENIRKMLIAMADDIRVIIIKLADRLHNMRTMDCMPEQKRRDKSLENMEVFAPIAHRLGIKTVKDELEDRSLYYLDPIGYKEIEDALLLTEDGRDKFIDYIKNQILDKTRDTLPNLFISGRVKSINSIYRKTFMQGKNIDQIFDIFAVRVIVDTMPDCYNVLGVVHDIFRPLPNRFKDYISMPKPNMYQSLHTTVFDANSIPFEVQIRTWEMHYTAEYGIAAHWKYKLGMGSGKSGEKLNENIERVKNMILDQLEAEDATDIAKNIKNDLDENDVYIFTPKGDVFSLPQGSTPIDMAYLIHTQVGHRMIGCKINSKMMPIITPLRNGDIVEVLTSEQSKGPSRDWLKFVKSSSAKTRINQWFKKAQRTENIEKGKELIEKEVKKLGLKVSDLMRPEWVQLALDRYRFNTIDDLHASIGFGGISVNKLMARLLDEYRKEHEEEDFEQKIEELATAKTVKPRKTPKTGVIVKGIDNCLVKLSKCCSPLPGDDIIGYITKGRGVTVHRTDCVNVKDLLSEPDRMIDVYWFDDVNGSYTVEIEILATDRYGLLRDVIKQVDNLKLKLTGVNTRTTKENISIIDISVEIENKDMLTKFVNSMKNIESVYEVTRKRG